MKLYDSDEKICHCDLKSSLTGDMTISFSIHLKDCMNGDYKLIEKDVEFFVKLGKKKKIYFYVADKSGVYKIQAKSDVISNCEFVHVVIVRNTECKRTVIYVNGKVNVSECMEDEFVTIPKGCGELCYFHGGECADYEMKSLKIYNVSLTFDDIKQEYVWNLCNKKELLQEIFCNNYANFHLEDNTYYYIMTPNGILFFENISKSYTGIKNEYPKFAFTYYNVEQNEKNLPLEGLKVAKYEDLCNLFDVDAFLTNIITWQFLPATNDFQIAHPKNISSGKVGYWSFEQNTPATTGTKYTGFTPFTPYFGNDINTTPTNQYNGNLKNGFIVSFIKLLLNQYFCTNNEIYRKSISALVDFLIDLPGSGSSTPGTSGIPDEYPTISPATNKISLHQGNFLNYLKIIDVLLENECIRNVIDDTRIATLKEKYDAVMTLLLNLQYQIGTKLTIWGEYYVHDGDDYTDITNDGAGNTLLSVPESAEILTYLMNLKCPSSVQKKAIKSAVEWLKSKSLDKLMGNNHVLYFNETASKMQLVRNNYPTTPSQLILHPHYYDVTGNGTDKVGLTPIAAGYDVTFNAYTFTQQIDVIGTWVQCVCDTYVEWEKVFEAPCNSNSNTGFGGKNYKSCKKC